MASEVKIYGRKKTMRKVVLAVFAIMLVLLTLVSGAVAADVNGKELLVIKGYYDRIEDVLADLGFENLINLVEDDNRVMNIDFSEYTSLFMNCDYGSLTDRPSQAFLDKVKAFVHGGGMLYVTDDSANFLKNWDSEMEYVISYDYGNFRSGNWKTSVIDPALKARFPADRFDANGNILIQHTTDNGEPIVNPGKATVLLQNADNPENPNAQPGQVQAIDFRPAAGGRVVYTTFHNHQGPRPVSGDSNYIPYLNVLTVMEYICGAMGTVSLQDEALEILGATRDDVLDENGSSFSVFQANGWNFRVPAGVAQLTFAIYAREEGERGSGIMALTAPNGTIIRVQNDPRGTPIVFHVTGQEGTWTLQCMSNDNIPGEIILTGLALDGLFGTASTRLPDEGDGGDDGDDEDNRPRLGCNAGYGIALALAGMLMFVFKKK
jgi:hypothetical protein